MEENSDSYLTIKAPSEIEIKIKGSRFTGRAVPCRAEEDAEEILSGLKKKFYDATHHCYAWQIGHGSAKKFRYSDAGEPSGTAGKPIHDQIDGKGLTDIIVVVTRYFGGVKLGTGGLTHAYSDTAAEAIEAAGIVKRFIIRRFSITVPYSDYNVVERLIHRYDGKIIGQELTGEAPLLKIEMRRSLVPEFKVKAIDSTSGRIQFASES